MRVSDLEPNASGPVHLVVVPHTHWDREWYQPFQDFRSRLVGVIDGLLDLLERDAAFAHFHLDGQTIVLEDYLEIRPQNRARLRRLVRAGRIAIGPWYVLPDEFLVSGEALIRNLRIGHHVASSFGSPLQVGYLPDQFGHIAQMPQILAGFGIDNAALWRGVGADVNRTLFTWEGIDGTAVFTVYMPLSGYSNGRALPTEHEALRERLAAIIAEQAPYRRVPLLLVMNGTDHQEPQSMLPEALAAATRGVEGLSYEIAPLRRFVDASRAYGDGLERHRGELRSPLRAHLLPGVTSARVRQKQRDFDNVSRLERYAEPLATWADLLAGGRALTDFTDWAWKAAVQNHPHDSICGCSVDQVHRDMEYRFDQVEMVGRRVVRQALTALVSQLDTAGCGPDSAVVVYNPNGAHSAVVTAAVSLDEPGAYELEDAAGRRLPLHVDATADKRLRRRPPTRLTFCAPRLTGHGFTVFALRRGRSESIARVSASANAIENAALRVLANDDGSLTITDLQSGLLLPRCNWFVDEGDRGDEYNFDPLRDPQHVSAPSRAPLVTVDADSAVATMTVQQSYALPLRLGADRELRVAEVVTVPITTRVRLYAGLQRVDFETVIDNHAADHRLRVHFQTPLTVASAFVEQAFATVERRLDLEPGDGFERPIGTGPQKTFTCIEDGALGVALFNRGIPEMEVRRTDTGTEIALTLIRAVGWLSRGDLRWRQGHAGPVLETPDAQSPGAHRFEYALTTYAGSWQSADLVNQAHAFAYPPIATLADAHPGRLLAEAALVRCDNPAVVVSALTPARRPGVFVLRCYNGSARSQTASIECPSATDIRAVDFLERRVRAAIHRRRPGVVRVTLRPFEILTLRVAGWRIAEGR